MAEKRDSRRKETKKKVSLKEEEKKPQKATKKLEAAAEKPKRVLKGKKNTDNSSSKTEYQESDVKQHMSRDSSPEMSHKKDSNSSSLRNESLESNTDDSTALNTEDGIKYSNTKEDENMNAENRLKSNNVKEAPRDENVKNEDQIFCKMEEAKDIHIGGIPFKSIKEAIVSYKRDSKNFFVGDILENCCRRNRRYEDQWYLWTKEMMDDIDKNEAVMNNALLCEGHKGMSELLEKGFNGQGEADYNVDRVRCPEWGLSLDRRIKDLMSGLKSLENMICSDEGMNTIWGKIKYKGFVKNSAREYFSRKKMNSKRKLDLCDYVKYKGQLWDEHYQSVKNKDLEKNLYD